jgi:hypothetical protein
VLGGPGLDVGRQHAERGHVLLEGGDVALGQLAGRDPFLVGAADDLVVDVREVAHEGDAIAREPQIARDDVEHHQHPGVADVGEVVDRHPARVHLDLARGQGDELFLHARHRVVDLHSLAEGVALLPNLPREVRWRGRRVERSFMCARPD